MEVKVGVSNHHVHLNKTDLDILFGENYELNVDRMLSQKGQFAAKERVILKTLKNEIKNVRVLGPVRPYTQVEISKTDAYFLGLNPPVRDSGDLNGSEVITIIGPKGEVTKNCCIIANRHIHISPLEVQKYDIDPKGKVNVRIKGEKGGIIFGVSFKVSEDFNLELHLDTDDANAHLIKQGDIVTIED